MNIDGSGAIEDVVTGLVRVRDVGLDPAAGMIYWNDRNSHKIQRAPIDGGPIEDLYEFISAEGKPHGMALDLEARMIYWTDTKTQWVMRGPMDGSGPTELLHDDDSIGLDDPWDIELDIIPAPPEPGDANGDWRVNDLDYQKLLAQFGAAPGLQSADFNNDHIVDLHDFALLRANFRFGVPLAPDVPFGTAAPEPATLLLLVGGGLISLRKRRKP